MGGKKEQKTTTTQNNDPWAPAQPHLQNIMTAAQGAYSATPKTAEQLFADTNQTQTWAADLLKQFAPTMNQGVAGLRQLADDTVGGKYLDPNTNPWLKQSVEQAIGLNTTNLMEQILPNVADQAILGGAYGGSGYGVAQGLAIDRANTTNTNAATSAYADNYQRERDRQLNAGSLYQLANELGIAPGILLGQIGDMEQGWEQSRKTAAAEAPWAGLDRYQSLVSGASQGYGTQTGTTTQPGRSGFGSFLGGAAGGASTGMQMGGPWGAAVGGVLGGLGGLFG